MFNFVICDNDSQFLKNLKSFIKNNIEYKSIHSFNEYTDSFYKIVNDDSIKNKFYILDIETQSQNGIIVASKIRKVDINSIIVFLTGYENKYAFKIAKSRFRYDALINKFDNFEKELTEVINDHSKYINFNRRISVQASSNITYTIDLNELLFIQSNKFLQKTEFQTTKFSVSTYDSLNKFENQLNADFVKVSRSCLVNKTLATFDYKNNVIKFTDKLILNNVMSQSFIRLHKN